MKILTVNCSESTGLRLVICTFEGGRGSWPNFREGLRYMKGPSADSLSNFIWLPGKKEHHVRVCVYFKLEQRVSGCSASSFIVFLYVCEIDTSVYTEVADFETHEYTRKVRRDVENQDASNYYIQPVGYWKEPPLWMKIIALRCCTGSRWVACNLYRAITTGTYEVINVETKRERGYDGKAFTGDECMP